MAELVAEEVVVDGCLAEQNRLPGCVPVEAPEPGEPEQERRNDDPDAVDANRFRVEPETIEAALPPPPARQALGSASRHPPAPGPPARGPPPARPRRPT